MTNSLGKAWRLQIFPVNFFFINLLNGLYFWDVKSRPKKITEMVYLNGFFFFFFFLQTLAFIHLDKGVNTG